jgi:hypothetical protein
MAQIYRRGPSSIINYTLVLLSLSFVQNISVSHVFVSALASDRTFGDSSKSSGLNSLSTTTGISTGSNDKDSCTSPKIYRTLQVQIIHRHGDRTPITPLKDEDFWACTLVPQETLDKISSNTNLVREDNKEGKAHTAGGRGPFGKLTELGLLQLIKVGNKLRDELVTDQQDHEIVDDQGNRHFPFIYHPQRPLHPSNIRIFSTDFPRTIQSVQGLLVGLFPDSSEKSIPIDVRHTSRMVPNYQQLAEAFSLPRPSYIAAKDEKLQPLAARATRALLPLLGPNALNFAVPNNDDDNEEAAQKSTHQNAHTTSEPLEWNQLAEITKCLAVRDLLPDDISLQDQQTIGQHAAWRWFEMTRDERLGFLALDELCQHQVEYLHCHETEPPVIVWSGHDFTLTGLMCAYRLEQPVVWPEYGSYLKLELLQVSLSDVEGELLGKGEEKEYVVRFSLNGETLRSQWNGGELQELIPLKALRENIGRK